MARDSKKAKPSSSIAGTCPKGWRLMWAAALCSPLAKSTTVSSYGVFVSASVISTLRVQVLTGCPKILIMGRSFSWGRQANTRSMAVAFVQDGKGPARYDLVHDRQGNVRD